MLGCLVVGVSAFQCHGSSSNNPVRSVNLLPRPLNGSGYTPMHGAGFQGRAEIAKLLIAHGLDPSDRHSDGFTPIHRACWGREQRHADTVRVLLKAGVPFDEAASNGCRPQPGLVYSSLLQLKHPNPYWMFAVCCILPQSNYSM